MLQAERPGSIPGNKKYFVEFEILTVVVAALYTRRQN
jgi:hypothetical protein